MAIKEPDKIWWVPLSKDEKLWVTVALAWMLISFLFMPLYHKIGNQNPPVETYRVSEEQFDSLLASQNVTGDLEGINIVEPGDSTDVYVKGSAYTWEPVLKLKKGVEYRVHLASFDYLHGFSVQPVNLNFMVVPGYDYVLKLTPTTSGEFAIVCNEYCGPGHHNMIGKIIVTD